MPQRICGGQKTCSNQFFPSTTGVLTTDLSSIHLIGKHLYLLSHHASPTELV